MKSISGIPGGRISNNEHQHQNEIRLMLEQGNFLLFEVKFVIRDNFTFSICKLGTANF